MDFIGSTAYYILCGIGLIILIVVLVTIQRRKSESQTQAPEITPKTAPSPENHIPKYAAGDEMDRINRNAYYQPPKKRANFIPGLILLILAVVTFWAYRTKPNIRIQNPNLPLNTNSTSPASGGELKFQLKSADYTSDNSKVYVTCVYTNEGLTSVFSVQTTIDLLGENDYKLQSVTPDEIGQIGPKETKEVTTAIEIEPQNIGKIKRIEGHVEYHYLMP